MKKMLQEEGMTLKPHKWKHRKHEIVENTREKLRAKDYLIIGF